MVKETSKHFNFLLTSAALIWGVQTDCVRLTKFVDGTSQVSWSDEHQLWSLKSGKWWAAENVTAKLHVFMMHEIATSTFTTLFTWKCFPVERSYNAVNYLKMWIILWIIMWILQLQTWSCAWLSSVSLF